MIQLLYGDVVQLIRNMPDQSYDLIFADPAYMVNEDDSIDSPQLINTKSWLLECHRLLKPNGNLLVTALFSYLDQVISSIVEAGFVRNGFQNLITWHKTGKIPHAHCRVLTDACEYIAWMVRGPNCYFDYLITKSYLGKQHHDFIEMPSCSYQELVKNENGIPACTQQKPLKLMRFLIQVFSPPNGRVLDLFSGTATTLVACRDLGRNGVGIEKDPDIYWVAQNRLYRKITDD